MTLYQLHTTRSAKGILKRHDEVHILSYLHSIDRILDNNFNHSYNVALRISGCHMQCTYTSYGLAMSLHEL